MSVPDLVKAVPANNKACNNAQAVDFVKAHQADAATVAQQADWMTLSAPSSE